MDNISLVEIRAEINRRDDYVYFGYTCPFCNKRYSSRICHFSEFSDDMVDDFLGDNWCPSTGKIFYVVV